MILPGAGRIWKATPTIITPKVNLITPFWYQTARYASCTDPAYDEWIARFSPVPVNNSFKLDSDKDTKQELMKILFPMHYA